MTCRWFRVFRSSGAADYFPVHHPATYPLIAILFYVFIGSGQGDVPPRNVVEYFYEEGCEICHRIDAEVLPLLNARFGPLCDVRRYDMAVETNYVRLAIYQESYTIDPEATAVMIVNGRKAFAGWGPISTELPIHLERLISGEIPPEDPQTAIVKAPDRSDGTQNLSQRVHGFTILGVAAAGLIDGINPCAISTLVFLISMLAALNARSRDLVLVGIGFCVVSFLTYMAIGFGLFQALYLCSGFRTVQSGLELAMVAVLALFAAVSFRDAYRFYSTHKRQDVMLKLPLRITLAIHSVVRKGLKSRHLFLGSLVVGLLVTVLESVCTGQVYVPTLVLVVKSGSSTWPAMSYLVLYNLMFILPLVTAFTLTYHGLRFESMLRWSQNNVVVSKVLLGCFFVGMAVLLMAL